MNSCLNCKYRKIDYNRMDSTCLCGHWSSMPHSIPQFADCTDWESDYIELYRDDFHIVYEDKEGRKIRAISERIMNEDEVLLVLQSLKNAQNVLNAR